LIDKYAEKVDPDYPQDCPTMGSMIESMDVSIGKLLDAVEKLGLEKETIIIFFSDNGGNMYNEVNGTTPTNNYPLRGGKATIYEGGTRVPMIVVWPGVVRPDTRSDAFVSSVDFYPTILEMAGELPKPGLTIDGVSIVPVLKEQQASTRDTIFCHFPHTVPATENIASTSVRKGDWKLIKFYADNPDQTDRYELYNLKKDIGEKYNLAEKYPAKVAEFDALIVQHLLDTEAIVPEANPNYKPLSMPIMEWQALNNCTLEAGANTLKVTATGADPYFQTNEVPAAIGPIKVILRAKADGIGDGQVFWTSEENPSPVGHFTTFSLTHDNAWHEYTVDITGIPAGDHLKQIRIDPGTNVGSGTGIIEFDWIRIETPGGTLLKEWDFGGSVPSLDWYATHSCTVEAGTGTLKVTVTGFDPYFQTDAVPAAVGPIKVLLRIKADGTGDGQVFWASEENPSFLGHFTTFSLIHDNVWHEYTVDITSIPAGDHLKQIRIDPGTDVGSGTGIIEFDWIRVETPGGSLLKEWTFD